ncbi:MAG: gamma-glutamyl-gamma-aminobutyrate hydrolase family protein, partial [Bdellovibrionales bacterium]|nr:gamma-glutamyl-gamma-aminobutyrate hydrolase family protein [Bdellovibrionales bacterium]
MRAGLHGFILILFLACLPAWAGGEFVVWERKGAPYGLVIPALPGETGAEAVGRYVLTLNSEEQLRPFATGLTLSPEDRLRPWKPGSTPTVLALANSQEDLSLAPDRMRLVLEPLKKRGARPQVLPVAALRRVENPEAHLATLHRSVDLLIATGGDDIAPSLYGQPVTHARRINPPRDAEEVAVVRSYLREGKGFFAGICRGHQLGGVASGCPLIQDIEKDLRISHPIGVDHEIVQEKEAGPFTRALFGPDTRQRVVSRHHQAVPGSGGANARVTATSADGASIAEITEYFGGKGVGLQTHPEDMAGSAFHE